MKSIYIVLFFLLLPSVSFGASRFFLTEEEQLRILQLEQDQAELAEARAQFLRSGGGPAEGYDSSFF